MTDNAPTASSPASPPCKRKSRDDLFQKKTKSPKSNLAPASTNYYGDKLYILKTRADIELVWSVKVSDPTVDGFTYALNRDVSAPTGIMNQCREWGFIMRANRRTSREDNSPIPLPQRSNQERAYYRSYFVRALFGDQSTHESRLTMLQQVREVSHIAMLHIMLPVAIQTN